MGFSKDYIHIPFHTNDIEHTVKFCSFMVILALGFIILFSSAALIEADDTDAKTFTADGIKYKTTSETTAQVIHCDNLNELVIPSSVRDSGTDYSVVSIAKSAFKNCKSLTSVSIGSNVESLADSTFCHCKYLAKIDVSKENSHYCSIDGILFNKEKTALIKCPTCMARQDYTIPSGVELIKNCAFDGCKSLVSVTIPDSVTSIGDYTFNECTSLTAVIIPDSVTRIGYCAFNYCKSLSSVTIGANVKHIASYAFDRCPSLTCVIIPETVKHADLDAFKGCKFFDFNGKKQIETKKDIFFDYINTFKNLSGYKYIGESSSKLIRHYIHEVSFVTKVGSAEIEGMDVEIGAQFTLPCCAITKKGFAFAGWSYNGKLYHAGETVTKVSGDMVFTTSWTRDTFASDEIGYVATSDTTAQVIDCIKSGNVATPLLISITLKCQSKEYCVTSINKSALKAADS